MKHRTTHGSTRPQHVPLNHRFRIQGFAGLASIISTFVVLFWGIGSGLSLSLAMAQTSDVNTWFPALNVSNSGAASQPVIAASGDGTSHVLWWDSFDGMRYLRVPPAISSTLTLSGVRPVVVPGMWADRQATTDVRTGRAVVSLVAPSTLRLLTDDLNRAHAFWPNVGNQLLYAATTGPASLAWSQPTVLADSASTMDITADVSNTLHLAYVRTTPATGLQPGLYYRAKTAAGAWLPPTLVYSNTYFRVDRPQDITLGVAADGRGAVVVTWYQVRLGQSFFAHSSDFGRTWSTPELASGPANHISAQSNVFTSSKGDFVLVYVDPGGRGCGFNQRKSTDAGQTWTVPEVILGEIKRCPSQWRFARATDKIWMVGALPQSGSNRATAEEANTRGAVTNIVVSWNETEWSSPAEINLSAVDSVLRQNRALGCLGISIAGSTMVGVGCDARSDVWISQASVSLDKLIVAPDLTWSKFAQVSNRHGPVSSSVAVAAAKQGNLYAVWTQSDAGETAASTIFFSRWVGTSWLKASRIIYDPKLKFEQPSIAASADDKLHLVWNGGRIRYSRAFARDAEAEQGWKTAQDLPMPSNVKAGKSPHILADPQGSGLYVIFSVPYNEKRGIYLLRSEDGGTTWKEPVQVFDAEAAGWESADQPQIQLDPRDNTLHAVWLKANLGNRIEPQAVYYARSTNGGQAWSQAQKLAEGLVDTPQIAIPDHGQVYVVWNQIRSGGLLSAPFEAWGQSSPDGGERWTESRPLPGFREISGKVSLATDGAGRLYLTGVSENAGGASELVYSSWSGQDWSQRETVGIGQQALMGNQTTTSILPADGKLVVLIRTTVLSDSGTVQFDLLSTDRKITLVPVVLQPTLTPKVTINNATPTASVVSATSTPEPLPTNIPTSEQPEPTDRQGFILGAIAAVTVLGVLAIGFGFWRNRRR